MNVRLFALVLGIVFTLIGLLGLAHVGVKPYTGPGLTIHGQEGDLLGLFHVNVLHNLVHLAFGIAGIGVYFAGAEASKYYAAITGVAYILLAILGVIPVDAIRTTFGLIPIDQNDVWLHGLIGVVAAYFGFAAPITTLGDSDTYAGGSTPTTPTV